MFVVTEAAAIRTAFEQSGELATAVELRPYCHVSRRFAAERTVRITRIMRPA
jgi:hypothetical protein